MPTEYAACMEPVVEDISSKQVRKTKQQSHVGFEVLTAMTTSTLLWDVTPCCPTIV
jgi:hypothetical protein